jgi:hypothetical protein
MSAAILDSTETAEPLETATATQTPEAEPITPSPTLEGTTELDVTIVPSTDTPEPDESATGTPKVDATSTPASFDANDTESGEVPQTSTPDQGASTPLPTVPSVQSTEPAPVDTPLPEAQPTPEIIVPTEPEATFTMLIPIAMLLAPFILAGYESFRNRFQ